MEDRNYKTLCKIGGPSELTLELADKHNGTYYLIKLIAKLISESIDK